MFAQFFDDLNVRLKLTNACNLRCKYCFQKSDGYQSLNLTLDLLDHFCKITLAHYKRIRIIFHGGEPLLVGLNFFTKCVDLIKKNSRLFDTDVKMSVQTNGVLLNEEFISYLIEQKIGFGLSFDGIENEYSRASTKEFMNCIKLLNEKNQKINVITIISRVNCTNLLQNYNFFKSKKINSRFDYYENSDFKDTRFDITASEYTKNLSELFDYWLDDFSCNIRLDTFHNLVKACFLGRNSLCTYDSCLQYWICVEPTGEVTPCNRIFPAKFRYGYIQKMNDIREVYESEGFKNLIGASIVRNKRCKEKCSIYSYCLGGCNYESLASGNLEKPNDFSCKSYQALLLYIKKVIKQRNIFNETNNIKNRVLKEMITNLTIKK
jgi:uncharacterized protein